MRHVSTEYRQASTHEVCRHRPTRRFVLSIAAAVLLVCVMPACKSDENASLLDTASRGETAHGSDASPSDAAMGKAMSGTTDRTFTGSTPRRSAASTSNRNRRRGVPSRAPNRVARKQPTPRRAADGGATPIVNAADKSRAASNAGRKEPTIASLPRATAESANAQGTRTVSPAAKEMTGTADAQPTRSGTPDTKTLAAENPGATSNPPAADATKELRSKDPSTLQATGQPGAAASASKAQADSGTDQLASAVAPAAPGNGTTRLDLALTRRQRDAPSKRAAMDFTFPKRSLSMKVTAKGGDRFELSWPSLGRHEQPASVELDRDALLAWLKNLKRDKVQVHAANDNQTRQLSFEDAMAWLAKANSGDLVVTADTPVFVDDASAFSRWLSGLETSAASSAGTQPSLDTQILTAWIVESIGRRDTTRTASSAPERAGQPGLLAQWFKRQTQASGQDATTSAQPDTSSPDRARQYRDELREKLIRQLMERPAKPAP